MNFSKRTGRRAQYVKFQAVLVAAVVAVGLGACAPSGQTETGPTGPTGSAGSITVGLSGEPAALRAGADQGTAAIFINTILQRGLLAYDNNAEIVPALAESFEQTGETSYSFKLNQGLEFHDGTPLTSANVKSTFDYLGDPANGARSLSTMSGIKSIETPDDITVNVELANRNAAFLANLAESGTAILPDAAFEEGAVNDVGAGPWQLTEYAEGISMTFEKFDAYYGADSIDLEDIVVEFYPDGQARTNALISGDVDLIDYVPWERFAELDSDDGIVLDSQAGTFMYVLFNTTSGPFADPLVRQAVAFGVQRENIVDAVFSGYGATLGGLPIPESNFAYDQELANTWSYDPEKAKALLEEAGYGDGFSATMLTSAQYAFHQDTAVLVQSDLAKIGIDLTLENPDWATRIAMGNAGEYDIAVSGSGGQINDPSFLTDFVSGSDSYRRSFGYSDEKTNEMLAAALLPESEEERKGLYDEAQRHILEQAPIVPLTTRAQAFAYSASVEGFTNLPGFLSFLSGYTMVNTSISDN